MEVDGARYFEVGGWTALSGATVIEPALTILLPGDVPMSFQRIEPGEFLMGQRGENSEEEPVHCVRITHAFYLGTVPVTQAQFAVWTRAEKIEHENHIGGRPEHPAESLDWYQAANFCKWLARLGQASEGWMACLPTEAEWEVRVPCRDRYGVLHRIWEGGTDRGRLVW